MVAMAQENGNKYRNEKKKHKKTKPSRRVETSTKNRCSVSREKKRKMRRTTKAGKAKAVKAAEVKAAKAKAAKAAEVKAAKVKAPTKASPAKKGPAKKALSQGKAKPSPVFEEQRTEATPASHTWYVPHLIFLPFLALFVQRNR